MSFTFNIDDCSHYCQDDARVEGYRLAGERAKEVTVGTYHAFCARVLREHAHVLGLPKRFAICDASDQLSAVKSAMRELRVHETTKHPSAVLARISLAKNRMQTPEEFLENGTGSRDQLVGSVWQRYQEFLARTRSLDFDDLLLQAVRLLREHPKVRDHYRARNRHVLVDEYQDTNKIQADIVDLLASAHKHLMVVGDDSQSIYSWRGANFQNIIEFPKRYPGCRIFKIETNYRSRASSASRGGMGETMISRPREAGSNSR